MYSRVLRLGNDLVVRVPQSIAKNVELNEGDLLEIEVVGEGAIRLRRADKVPSLTQLVSQITPENRYEELSAGSEIGNETAEW